MRRWSKYRTRVRRQVWLGLISVVYLLVAAVALTVRVWGSSPRQLVPSADSRGDGGVDVPEVRVRRDAGGYGADLTANETEDPDNCTPRAVNNFPDNFLTLEDTQDGGVVFHILIALYLFAALAIVCDDYFVPSLERICEDLGLQEDVAGATFMAAGSSAPELCTSVVGVFIAESDVGVGTIVGSAVFNILFIIGLCAIFAGMIVELTWYPLMRDTVFYLLSVLALVIIIEDSKVQWYEAMVMLLMYAVYIGLMYFNRRLEDKAIATLADFRNRWNMTDGESQTANKRPLLESSKSQEKTTSGSSIKGGNGAIAPTGDAESGSHGGKPEDEESQYVSPWQVPDHFLLRVLWVAMVPVKLVCFLTVPDCRKEGVWRRLYPVTFVTSVVWIAAFTYILVWMITITGDALDIPDTVMGLTLLAAGTSLPDCLASILVVRDGYGDMAVSNSIGSNVFDILLCLGLPWLIETAAFNKGDHLEISSSGLLYSSLTLLATVVFLLISISCNRWRLNKPYGVTCLVVYVFVITLSSLYELNVFGDLKPSVVPPVT
ncbi:hypothetical protein BaRGS_00012500 [Batillaria attramentaria]|uniref:Sodium/calcium exchanger membrane region domain-containing protein n=1 Tax=Batillaria attramentaria TaxID=370345 RepID=A0ABD0LAG4_9CAEN